MLVGGGISPSLYKNFLSRIPQKFLSRSTGSSIPGPFYTASMSTTVMGSLFANNIHKLCFDSLLQLRYHLSVVHKVYLTWVFHTTTNSSVRSNYKSYFLNYAYAFIYITCNQEGTSPLLKTQVKCTLWTIDQCQLNTTDYNSLRYRIALTFRGLYICTLTKLLSLNPRFFGSYYCRYKLR